MYIGPQGIVHGTTITVLNAFRKINRSPSRTFSYFRARYEWSPTQAGNIAGCITVCAEVNAKITHIRHSQGWINEVIEDIDELVKEAVAKANKEIVSIAYLGNVVDVWEKFDEKIFISIWEATRPPT
jgi:urocanate hydratase